MDEHKAWSTSRLRVLSAVTHSQSVGGASGGCIESMMSASRQWSGAAKEGCEKGFSHTHPNVSGGLSHHKSSSAQIRESASSCLTMRLPAGAFAPDTTAFARAPAPTLYMADDPTAYAFVTSVAMATASN